MHPRAPSLAAAASLLGVVVLTGCGPPPDVAPTPEGPLPAPATPGTPGPSGSPMPPLAPSAPTGDPAAVDCAGQPSPEQVLSALREEGLLPGPDEASLTEGPLCADDWQFAVITVPDRDPLQVITSGPADDLTLVTAGTDVCTVEVRVHAPPGIRVAAGCVG